MQGKESKTGYVRACPITPRGENCTELLRPAKAAGKFIKAPNAAPLFFMVVLLCSQLSVSCSEIESEPVERDTISPDTGSAHDTDEAVLLEKLTVSTKGTHVYIVDPDNPEDNFITLTIDEDILVSFEDGLLDGTVSPGDDENTVKVTISFAKDVEPDFHIDTMHIAFSHTPNLTVSASVIARPSSLLVVAPDEVPTYISSNIGHAIDVSADFLSQTSLVALDTHALYSDSQITIDTNSKTTGTEINLKDYNEVVKQVTESLGIKGNIPGTGKAKGLLFSGAFNQSFTKNSTNASELEFTVEILQKRMASAYLHSDFELDNAKVIQKYISDEANEVLNVPSDPKYQLFSNDKDGIFKLYEQYGTYVITSGVFGGTYIYAYARKQNSYFASTSNYAGASLSMQQAAHSSGGNWMDSYISQMHAVGGQISADGSNYNSDHTEIYGEKTAFVVVGGDASPDFGKWDESLADAGDNLALIQYSANTNDEETGGLIPLFYLAAPDSDRRAAMEEYLLPYLESKKLPEVTPPKLVVADFKMLTTDNNGHDAKDTPEQKVMKDPTGMTYRLYSPLMANSFARVDKGKMLDTSQDAYIVVADGTDQLWWYALAFADELVAEGLGGIKDIRFYDKDDENVKNGKYSTGGNRADHDMNYPEIDNHYVALSRTTDPDEMITGVGLLMNNSDGYSVIASSAGTEMILPLTFREDKAESQPQFKKHWGNSFPVTLSKTSKTFPVEGTGDNPTSYWTLGSDKGNEKSESWFGNTAAANSSSYKLFPVYVKSDLGDDFKVQKPQPW